jgi:hypothetical protein
VERKKNVEKRVEKMKKTMRVAVVEMELPIEVVVNQNEKVGFGVVEKEFAPKKKMNSW